MLPSSLTAFSSSSRAPMSPSTLRQPRETAPIEVAQMLEASAVLSSHLLDASQRGLRDDAAEVSSLRRALSAAAERQATSDLAVRELSGMVQQLLVRQAESDRTIEQLRSIISDLDDEITNIRLGNMLTRAQAPPSEAPAPVPEPAPQTPPARLTAQPPVSVTREHSAPASRAPSPRPAPEPAPAPSRPHSRPRSRTPSAPPPPLMRPNMTLPSAPASARGTAPRAPSPAPQPTAATAPPPPGPAPAPAAAAAPTVGAGVRALMVGEFTPDSSYDAELAVPVGAHVVLDARPLTAMAGWATVCYNGQRGIVPADCLEIEEEDEEEEEDDFIPVPIPAYARPEVPSLRLPRPRSASTVASESGPGVTPLPAPTPALLAGQRPDDLHRPVPVKTLVATRSGVTTDNKAVMLSQSEKSLNIHSLDTTGRIKRRPAKVPLFTITQISLRHSGELDGYTAIDLVSEASGTVSFLMRSEIAEQWAQALSLMTPNGRWAPPSPRARSPSVLGSARTMPADF